MATRQRAEAVGKLTSPATGLTVLWSGTRFTLPRAEDFPLEALEAEEEGKHLTALKLILGAGQYTVWRALASTAADAEEFSAAVMKELGREPSTVALLLADEATAEALEADFCTDTGSTCLISTAATCPTGGCAHWSHTCRRTRRSGRCTIRAPGGPGPSFWQQRPNDDSLRFGRLWRPRSVRMSPTSSWPTRSMSWLRQFRLRVVRESPN
jgi:hypothetical protein